MTESESKEKIDQGLIESYYRAHIEKVRGTCFLALFTDFVPGYLQFATRFGTKKACNSPNGPVTLLNG